MPSAGRLQIRERGCTPPGKRCAPANTPVADDGLVHAEDVRWRLGTEALDAVVVLAVRVDGQGAQTFADLDLLGLGLVLRPGRSVFVKERQRFERLEMTKEELLEMFSYNKYKQHIISTKIPDGTSTTVYRNGPLIDLCRGPHVPDTGRIEAFSIMKNSASYFLGSQENDSLQRIYGVSFPDKKKMAEHKKFLEEAAKRDHRKLGKEQELFMFHELSPGSAFFLPHGTRIYNTLLAYLRDQYHKRDYQEGLPIFDLCPSIFG